MDEGKFAADFVAKNFENIWKLAKSTYDKLDETLQVKLKTAYIEYLSSVGEKYSRSKSFFIRDQSVGLYSYYEPTGIQCGKKIIQDPSYISATQQHNRAVITGTGGSGKTVLMKHLFLDCIKSHQHVPVLVELRDLNSEKLSLLEAIKDNLDSHGYNITGDYVARALEAGHFSLFLDGFDEVEYSKRKKLIGDIRKISKKYSKCPITISSRPDDVFQGIEEFDVFKILPLDVNSAVRLIEKLPFDAAIKKKFIQDLQASLFSRHSSFLSNPLLLSIMLLTYGENAEIPTKLSLFYNQAYEALFQRHDAYKGGFRRKRKTNLDIQDFSRVFSLFSLQTYEKRRFKMPRTDCLGFIEKSRNVLGKEFSANDYLYDLLSAACLMLEDGLEIAYSHRSFQEYFVALHISNAPPDVQSKLLKRYWVNINTDEVIYLLLELNPDLVERELLVPKLQELFDELKVTRSIGVTHAARYLKKMYKTINVEKRILSATLRDGSEGISSLVHLAIQHMDTYKSPGEKYFRHHHGNIFDNFGKNGTRTEYPTKELTYRSAILAEVIAGDGAFSSCYLSSAYAAFKLMKSKHAKRLQSLDDLLGI